MNSLTTEGTENTENTEISVIGLYRLVFLLSMFSAISVVYQLVIKNEQQFDSVAFLIGNQSYVVSKWKKSLD